MSGNYRLSVNITERHKKFLDSLPYGGIKLIIYTLLDDLIEFQEREGPQQLALRLMEGFLSSGGGSDGDDRDA